MLSSKAIELKSFLAREYWFATCSRDFQDALLEMGEIVCLSADDHVYRFGVEDDYGLFCILAGSVSVAKTNKNGEKSIVVYLEPYHWFGELPLIDGRPRGQDAIANEPTSLLVIPKLPIRRWLASNPAHWQHIANLCAYKLRLAYDLSGYSGAALKAVAGRLVCLSHGYGSFPHRSKDYIRLSQDKLALMLGLSRISVNRALAELESQCVIRCQYGGVKIMDINRLKMISNITSL